MSHKIPNFPSTTGVVQRFVCPKFVFGRGSVPDPAGGAHDAPPDPLVGWGGEYPLPIPHPLDAYGISISASRISFSESWQPYTPVTYTAQPAT